MSNEIDTRSADPLPLLLRIMVQPRATLRLILDSLPDELAVPLVLIATFSQTIVEEDYGRLVEALDTASLPLAVFIGVLAIAVGAVITVGLFYIFSYLVAWIGRRLGGAGDAEEIRSALAWGSVPWIWALVFRIPVRAIWGEQIIAIVHSRSGEMSWSEASSLITQSGLVVPIVIFALLEATAAIWYVVLMSKCVGEAHAFSAWRGFGNLLLAIFVPLVTVLGAIFGTILIISSLKG